MNNVTIKSCTDEYIIFNVKSTSRDLIHEVIFNRLTSEWSCECEDYYYRKRACKHTRMCKNLLNSLVFECSSTRAYTGITTSQAEIEAEI